MESHFTILVNIESLFLLLADRRNGILCPVSRRTHDFLSSGTRRARQEGDDVRLSLPSAGQFQIT